MYKGGEGSRLGTGTHQAVTRSQWRPQWTLQRALKQGRSYRTVLSWGERARPLQQALDAGCPGKGLSLSKTFFGEGSPPVVPAVACCDE